ncbi:MAG: dTMP kinase [Clostridiales bacterium]|nr:dTMP kinase [Clostridiales bacterium]
MRPGYFITFEGIDGCGKSTSAKMLAERLQAAGQVVTLTREPGAGRLGSKLRRMLLTDDSLQPEARAEALLFAADRAAHVQEVILPALKAGNVVLCDRYTDSTLAYQGGGRGLPEAFLRRLNDFAGFGLCPDITFFLSLPIELARLRQGHSPDRLEQEDGEFFFRIAEVYRRLAAEEPARICVIDATQTPEQVLADIVACLPDNIINAKGKAVMNGG